MKKLNTVLLAISLVLSAFSFTAFTEVPPGWFYCDVNGDELTDNLDAAYILKYDAGVIGDIENGDANGDGRVDNLDAAMVLKYDAGLDPNSEYGGYVKDCEFEAMYVTYVPYKYRDDEGGVIPGIPAMVIRSTEELRDYLGDVTELSNGGASPFMPYEKYNGEFFENNILILEITGSSASSDTYKVDSVKYGSEGLDIVIEFIVPELSTDDIVYRTIFIALDKAYDVPAEKVKVDYVYSHSYSLFYGVHPHFTPTPPPGGQTWPDVRIIRSVEEYNTYISTSGFDLNASLPGIHSYNTAYNGCFTESYFENYVLMAIVTPSRPTTTRYRVEGYYNIKKDVPSIDITVESFEVNYGDEKIAGNWIIMLDLDKDIFEDDIWNVEFTAYESFSKEIDFKATNVRTSYNEKVLSPTIIDAKWELDQYYRANKDPFYFEVSAEYGAPSFSEVITAYDEAFFENNRLLVIPIKSGSGSNSYQVKSVVGKTENGHIAMDVVVEAFYPFVQTADMAQWFLLVEFDNSYLLGDQSVSIKYEYFFETSTNIQP